MMQDWNAYRDALLAKVADYGKLSPDVMRGKRWMAGPQKRGGLMRRRMN